MKKFFVLMLALLLTGSAMAGVTISCAQVGTDPCVAISYAASDDANRPRAFGLDITVDNGATIDAIISDNADYWVHPTNIVIVDGNVTAEGTAEADPCDAPSDTELGLTTSGLTIEMGSLYDPCDPQHPNPPSNSGVLITLQVSGDCNVTVSGNGARGNVVLESAVEASTNLDVTCSVSGGAPDCFDSGHADYAEWVAVGKPTCWCYTYHCDGDADGLKLGNKKDGYFQVENADMTMILNSWKLASGYDICADVTRSINGNKKDGYFRVENADMTVILNHWKNDGTLTGGCGGSL